MSGVRLDGYSAAMSQSLYEQSKAVGEMVNAYMEKTNEKRSQITDTALEQIQKSTQAKRDMLRIGSMLDVYA